MQVWWLFCLRVIVSIIYKVLPFQLVYAEHWTVFADTDIALLGILYAAEAGAESASHLVLERHLAVCIFLPCEPCYGKHHGLRSADAYLAECLPVPDGMVCDKAFLSLRAVFCGDVHLAYGTESVQLEEVFP